jgi:CBS domain containing-hemolysin-like protein
MSGWVIEKAGIIPHAGYQFEHKNLSVEVLKSTVKRVLQAKVVVNEVDPDVEKETEE